MFFSLRSLTGFAASDSDEIIRVLFSPIRPWEEDPLLDPIPEETQGVLRTIRFLGR